MSEKFKKMIIQILPNSLLMIQGLIRLKNSDGNTIETEDPVFLCRCGHSNMKPFCDGSHHDIKFD